MGSCGNGGFIKKVMDLFRLCETVQTTAAEQTIELAKKSDKTYVDTELAKKSDKTYVDTELAKKLDSSAKATSADVNSGIVGKWIDAALLKLKLSGVAHTVITSIDLKPTGNANEFTVEIGWTDKEGVAHTATDPTPVTFSSGGSPIEIVNNLVDGGAGKVLSAEQGPVVKTMIEQRVLSTDKATSADVNSGIVGKWIDAALLKLKLSGVAHTTITSIDLKPTENANEFTVKIRWTDKDGVSQTVTDPTPVTFSPTELVNDLITGGVDKALTAEQGKILNETKAGIGDTNVWEKNQFSKYKTPLLVFGEIELDVGINTFEVTGANLTIKTRNFPPDGTGASGFLIVKIVHDGDSMLFDPAYFVDISTASPSWTAGKHLIYQWTYLGSYVGDKPKTLIQFVKEI